MKRPSISSPVEIKVEAAVNPSEDAEKVIAAIENVVERCSPEFRYGSRAIGRTQGVEPLALIYEQVRSRSAMGVLRRMLMDNRSADSTWFYLNKQAAAAGIAAVIEDEQESPLGPIRITISCEELDTLVDWLVPET
ncbi:MAG TPA: RNA-binding domain-containing protein [Nitrososphaera sp.]|nr:RNA-binding domain-containing protein [Nitrososphaera sp.]